MIFWVLYSILSFQSTPPARGATAVCPPMATALVNFNPRPPRGGRPDRAMRATAGESISIHAPREGGDHI